MSLIRLWIALKLATLYMGLSVLMLLLLVFSQFSQRISDMSSISMTFPNGRVIKDVLKWYNFYDTIVLNMIPRFKRLFFDELMVNEQYKNIQIFSVDKHDLNRLHKTNINSEINPNQYTVLFIGSCT
eukprot:16511_1